jgi:hypothetical protein
MCELLAAAAAEPFAMGNLWEITAGLERYGQAAFGWGAAWVTGDGGLAHHVSTAAFRDDPAQFALAPIRTRSLVVHLRRPSRLSTIGLPDTQPFLDPQGRFAFCHNGDLAGSWRIRPRYVEQGRIAGKADSEVGQRWLEDRWAEHELELAWPQATGPEDPDPCRALAALHAEMGGQANLMALTPRGVTHVYAGNTDNALFRFRLGRLALVTTGIHSADRSLFRYVVHGATERHLIRPGQRFELAAGA